MLVQHAYGEIILRERPDRRRSERYQRREPVSVADLPVLAYDRSMTGLSVVAAQPLPVGAIVPVVTSPSAEDAIIRRARVVRTAPSANRFIIGLEFVN